MITINVNIESQKFKDYCDQKNYPFLIFFEKFPDNIINRQSDLSFFENDGDIYIPWII